MATMARRFRLSETSFIQTSTSDTADYRHRIFVVEGEIPFAGHPSLGTAAVWARRRGGSGGEYVQQTISGEQSLKVELRESSGTVTIWQNAASFGELVEGPDPRSIGTATARPSSCVAAAADVDRPANPGPADSTMPPGWPISR